MWYREKNDRSKDTLKKIVPATYSQVESANNKIVKEIDTIGKENEQLQTTNEVVQITGAESVPLGTLDRYEETHPMDVGLIKVDIEGAEQSFLRGARRTIEKYKPVLLMSIYHNADDFFNIKPMIESWNLGYKFRIHKPIDYSVSREVLLIAEVR